jgi:predicted RNA methylase
MRSAARLKMGYYPLPESEGEKLRALLSFATQASVIDPCVGQGTALRTVTSGAPIRCYGVELDAERARIASSAGIETIHGNTFDAVAKAESFSLLYLNPPYDSEIGSIANRRMEAVFLEHTYCWLVMDGVLVLVIPFERLRDCAGVLSSHFAALNVLRMTDPDSMQYRQIAVLGVRREVRGIAVENNKRQLQIISGYGCFQKLLELQPGACTPYSVPASGKVEMSYRGLPYDLLEDLLPQSGAWRQAMDLLLPHDDIATGRPITPLHGGHVGLLCTAGLLNGVFGEGENRHIARWRSVKHMTTFVEEEGGAEIIHHRERWTNELRLVYADGRTLKLTESPLKKEGDADGECTSAVRAA